MRKNKRTLSEKLKSDKVKYYLGDVRDKNSLYFVMKDVDFVFHAAALKQVQSCEFYPLEAIKTNVIGTDNVLQSAIESGVKKVICLSTDKAVYPINAMGMSKAMMEKVIVSKARHNNNQGTTICCTRYGNVMASRGSVSTILQGIISNEPVTVTDKNMTRFMMSLDDAVNLVLFAFNNSENGDIFVQKSPAATIETLVKSLYKLFNKKSMNIKNIGTRHGEKLFEVFAKQRGKIYR